jgi:hypothetical protein
MTSIELIRDGQSRSIELRNNVPVAQMSEMILNALRDKSYIRLYDDQSATILSYEMLSQCLIYIREIKEK